MIKDYNDDVAMAEYGRYCARNKAIREAKEAIRDSAVMLGNTLEVSEINKYCSAIVTLSDNLIEAIELQ